MSTNDSQQDVTGILPGAVPRKQSVTADWEVLQDRIDGVALKEIRPVMKRNGYLTEIYRADWELDGSHVDQVFQLFLNPADVEAWHVHAQTTDRFFAASGSFELVLYDNRKGSPTLGRINVFRLADVRPGIVSVPPGVWHGIRNIGPGSAIVLNLVDRAYRYEGPDHFGLPADTDQIPYRF